MAWINSAIAELEEGSVEDLWEPPAAFRDLDHFGTWILYGKKGVGKSTVVDYLQARTGREWTVVVLRPADADNFYVSFESLLAKYQGLAMRPQTILAEQFVHVAITVAAMASWYERHRKTVATGDLATVYNFLVPLEEADASPLRRAIAFIESATVASPTPTEFTSFIEKHGAPAFPKARDAFYRLLRKNASQDKLLICVDDIDDINFTFDAHDRVFVDALIGATFVGNQRCVKSRTPLRILLTCPSELYNHRHQWGSDKVRTKALHLKWENPDSIQALVNRRIGVKLNVRKRSPRYPGDKFSREAPQTWNRVFPARILNRRGTPESAFEYCLRHTFYTPRELLVLIDTIYEDEARLELEPGTETPTGLSRWSELFQQKVSEAALESVESFKEIFSKIYEGLEGVMDQFADRPNLWCRRQLESHVTASSMLLRRREDGHTFAGEHLIAQLQGLGFFGLGSRNERRDTAPGIQVSFDTRFSFLSHLRGTQRWSLAVIPPVFYETLRIRSHESVVVAPHVPLRLTARAWDQLQTYVPDRNVFGK